MRDEEGEVASDIAASVVTLKQPPRSMASSDLRWVCMAPMPSSESLRQFFRDRRVTLGMEGSTCLISMAEVRRKHPDRSRVVIMGPHGEAPKVSNVLLESSVQLWRENDIGLGEEGVRLRLEGGGEERRKREAREDQKDEVKRESWREPDSLEESTSGDAMSEAKSGRLLVM